MNIYDIFRWFETKLDHISDICMYVYIYTHVLGINFFFPFLMGQFKTCTDQLTSCRPRSGVSDLKGSKSLGPPPGYDKDGIIRKFWSNCKIKHGKYECYLTSNRAWDLLVLGVS